MKTPTVTLISLLVATVIATPVSDAFTRNTERGIDERALNHPDPDDAVDIKLQIGNRALNHPDPDDAPQKASPTATVIPK